MEDIEKRVEKLEKLLNELAQAISKFAIVTHEALKYQQRRLDILEDIVKVLMDDYKTRKEFFKSNVL